MFRIFFILLLLSSFSFSITVIAVTYPIEKFFLKKIIGTKAYILTLQESASKFNLNEIETLKKYANSHYYFTFNLAEEKKIASFLKKENTRIKTFNMLENVPTLTLKNKNINPYVWFDPILSRKIVDNIYKKVIKIIPEEKKLFKFNYTRFLDELDNTYLDIKKRLDESRLYGVFTFNEELDYFTKRFRINNYHKKYRTLNINEVSSLLKFVRKENIKHILVPKDSDYIIAQSFKGYISGKIVEYNLYGEYWKVNLYNILRGIENFKNK